MNTPPGMTASTNYTRNWGNSRLLLELKQANAKCKTHRSQTAPLPTDSRPSIGERHPLHSHKNSFEQIRFSRNHPALLFRVVPADSITGGDIRIHKLDGYSLTVSRHPVPHVRPFPVRRVHVPRV